MFLDRIFGLSLSLSEITLLFDRTNSLEFTARWFVWSSCSLQTFSARLKNTPLN